MVSSAATGDLGTKHNSRVRDGVNAAMAAALRAVRSSGLPLVTRVVALRLLEGTPFRVSAGSALPKLVAAMQVDGAAAARDLASRIHLLGDAGATPSGNDHGPLVGAQGNSRSTPAYRPSAAT